MLFYMSILFIQMDKYDQSSHASWNVLDFFLENSRTWKVLEIEA